MQSVHTRILMGCNRYHNAELLKYAIRNVIGNPLHFHQFFFLIDFLDGKDVGMAHFGHANYCIFGGDVGK